LISLLQEIHCIIMTDQVGPLSPDDILTAVVLADPYTALFNPLNPLTPHCLMALAGRPLLDYTLECLLHNGVSEVILYLSNSPSMVRSWLTDSKWNQDLPPACRPLNITTIVNEDCRSVGDACRDLDEKGIVRGDFLLVSGDLVASVRLGEVVEKHKARPAKDKHSIMTKVYMEAKPGNCLITRGSELVLACDKATDQILFYQRAGNTSYNFPVELFQHEEVSVCYDLSDPGIAVCHPTVLALFSDNFDIQDMDTLTAEILESDLVDSTIYMETLIEGMAARAFSPYMFLTLSNMVMSRWFFPMVPPSSSYKYSMNNVYKGKECKVGKASILEEEVIIGHKTVVGAGCELSQTSLGSNCFIGEDCVLFNCVVEDKVTLGKGVVISNCIIGKGSIIPAGVKMGEKVIIGEGVELGEGVTIPDGARMIATEEDDWGEDEGEDDAVTAGSEWGPKAFVYKEDDADDEESVVSDNAVLDTWGEVYHSDDEDDASSIGSVEEESDQDFGDFDPESEEEAGGGEHEDVINFRREVIDSIARGLEQGVASDNLVLEINGSKHAWNITLSEVNQCVLYAVLTANIPLAMEDLTPAVVLPTVLKNITSLLQLLTKYSRSKSGQQYYMEGLEGLVEKHPIFMEIIAKVLHNLYDKDVLSDETILAWNKKLSSAGPTEKIQATICSKIKPLIAWLEQSDSESEDDSD